MSLTLTVFFTCIIHSCLFCIITVRVETSWRGKSITLIHHLADTLVTHSYVTLCDPMDCSPPGSSVHGILQAKILEWVAFPSPGIFSSLGLNSPTLQADSLPSEPPGMWKIPKEMRTSDHLTCLLRKLYSGQEATVTSGVEQ